MTRCLLGMGANLGDPARQLTVAAERLATHPQLELLKISRLLASQPIGGPAGQPPFLNAAALIETRLSPGELLAEMQLIENSLGRRRTQAWEARSLDIDLLLYGDAIVHEAGLRIPHPWMVTRAFVLEPAAEIAGGMRHPLTGWTIDRLLEHLQAVAPRFALAGWPDEAVADAISDQLETAWVSGPSQNRAVEVVRSTAALASINEPTVPSLGQRLEFLRQCIDQLQHSSWNLPGPICPVLSTFSLDESLVEARATLSAADWRRYRAEFERMTDRIAPPKLVMLVHGPRPPGGDVSQGAEGRFAALRQRIITCGLAPYVEVSSLSYDDVIREVSGAVVAMSPGR